MNAELAIKTIKDNARDISLMEENINESHESEISKEIINILFSEMVSAKKYLSTIGIFSV